MQANSINRVQARLLKQQRGMTLIVGLIMVLLMTVVGMAAIRGSNMQELMAGNMRDRNLAFQAAEAGLRQGENLLTNATLPAFDGTRVGLYQAINNSRNTGFWDSYSWNTASATTSMSLEYVNTQPRYVIEEVTNAATLSADGGAIDFSSTLKTEDTMRCSHSRRPRRSVRTCPSRP